MTADLTSKLNELLASAVTGKTPSMSKMDGVDQLLGSKLGAQVGAAMTEYVYDRLVDLARARRQLDQSVTSARGDLSVLEGLLADADLALNPAGSLRLASSTNVASAVSEFRVALEAFQALVDALSN